MFKNLQIWDYTIFTKGTTVQLEGYSTMNDFRFKGLEYRVKNTKYDMLIVQSKNGKTYEIGVWEIGDDADTDLTIKIIKQEPYMIPF